MRKAPARSSPGVARPALSATLVVAGIALAPGSRALAAPSPAPAITSVSPAPSLSATMPPPAYSGSAIAGTAAKLAEALHPQAR
ncbi:MAG TPA: serine/threonine protein kinase, partial [Polyangiaceae bacterium]|nr:serine/threonine protein kinase [Polyangiaceae bacterium]